LAILNIFLLFFFAVRLRFTLDMIYLLQMIIDDSITGADAPTEVSVK